MTTETDFNLTEQNKAKRFTAVFGGTFDPIHTGHIKLAEEVLAQDLADEVMFVPAAKPPHKLDKPISPANHRLEMVKLVLEEYPHFSVSDYEIVNQRKTSYTVNTLRALQAAFPERRFRLMMGMDNFLDLNSWHKFQEIISNYELIVFTRPETRKISMQSELLTAQMFTKLLKKQRLLSVTIKSLSRILQRRIRRELFNGTTEKAVSIQLSV